METYETSLWVGMDAWFCRMTEVEHEEAPHGGTVGERTPKLPSKRPVPNGMSTHSQ
jgi:hypothetical protein